MDAIDFGKRIKAMRLTLGMSQAELCDAVPLPHRVQLSTWETGYHLPSAASVLALSSFAQRELGDDGLLALLGDQGHD